ncbi:MAG: hypothetical protein ACOCQD_00265 [archaeon]
MELNRLIEQALMTKRQYMENTYLPNQNVDVKKSTKRLLWPSDIKEFNAASDGVDSTLDNHTFTVEAGEGENSLSKTLASNEYMIIEGFYLPASTDYNIKYIEIDLGASTNRIWIGDWFQNDDDGFVFVQDPLIVDAGTDLTIRFYSDATAEVTIQVLGTHYRTKQ